MGDFVFFGSLGIFLQKIHSFQEHIHSFLYGNLIV